MYVSKLTDTTMNFSDDDEDVTGDEAGKTTGESVNMYAQRNSVTRRVSFGRPSNLSVTAKTSSADDRKPMLSLGRRGSLDTNMYRRNNPRRYKNNRRGSLGSIESAPANMPNQPSADIGTAGCRDSATDGSYHGSTGSTMSGAGGLDQTKRNISARRRSSLQSLACSAAPTLATSVSTYADNLSETSRSDYCSSSDRNKNEEDNFTANSFSTGTSSRRSSNRAYDEESHSACTSLEGSIPQSLVGVTCSLLSDASTASDEAVCGKDIRVQKKLETYSNEGHDELDINDLHRDEPTGEIMSSFDPFNQSDTSLELDNLELKLRTELAINSSVKENNHHSDPSMNVVSLTSARSVSMPMTSPSRTTRTLSKWMDHDTSSYQRARRSATTSHIPSISQPLDSSPSNGSSSDETVKACNKTGSKKKAFDDALVLAVQKKEVLQSLAELDFEIAQENEYIDQLKDRRRELQQKMEDETLVLNTDGAKKDEAWAIPSASRFVALDSVTVHEEDYNRTGQNRAA